MLAHILYVCSTIIYDKTKDIIKIPICKNTAIHHLAQKWQSSQLSLCIVVYYKQTFMLYSGDGAILLLVAKIGVNQVSILFITG